ncbi:MAG TPA: acyltransferase [Candidatus Eisenbacteria bacterium]|nr:acyltransferase [Candidatus Eisenbacteria bacterium]
MKSDVPRNPGIDVVRGLSIALVIVHHVAIRIPLRKTLLATVLPVRLLNALTSNGYEAVFVFFVVSGFLITTNALGRWGRLDAIDLRAFYVRRAARILPCLVLLLSVLSVLHVADVRDFTIVNARQSLPRAVLSALGLHLNWYEGHTGWLPGAWDVLWSLSIEEAFYLCFPIVCVALAGRALFVPALVLLAASLPWTRAALAGNEIWQEKAYLPGMAAIAVGVLGALLVRRLRAPRRWVVRVLGAAGAAGIGSVLIVEDLWWRVLGNGTMLLLTVSAAALVVACHWSARDGTARLVPGTAWLMSFGRLSYESYLTHMFVVFGVVRVFSATHAGLAHGYLWYLPALAGSWLAGMLVARFFSIPCEKALRARWSRAPARQALVPEP